MRTKKNYENNNQKKVIWFTVDSSLNVYQLVSEIRRKKNRNKQTFHY